MDMNGLISKPFGRKIDIDAAIMQLIAYFCRSAMQLRTKTRDHLQ